MWVASLGSGSRGNATLVRGKQGCILIDCGFSLRQFEQRLERLDMNGSGLRAILVTHEHSDHGKGVIRVAQRYAIPLWMTVGTARALQVDDYHVLTGGARFDIDDLEVEVITVPHDAAEPVQFVITENLTGCRLGVLTDSGHVTQHMIELFSGLDGLLLEFNYDPEMLQQGPYPERLKHRVGGPRGHLSNLQSIDFLKHISSDQRLNCLIAGHISQKNNNPELVHELIVGLPSEAQAARTLMACQEQGFDWIEIMRTEP
jgi:phosphoribosyl 1,2-cyclic phosphodiesterase